MATPWRTTFNEIRISCKNDAELSVRVEDMESRGFELIDSYVESKRYKADTVYEKHIAIMKKREDAK